MKRLRVGGATVGLQVQNKVLKQTRDESQELERRSKKPTRSWRCVILYKQATQTPRKNQGFGRMTLTDRFRTSLSKPRRSHARGEDILFEFGKCGL